MKLRISGNSVRLRLKPSEVEQFQRTGIVEDRVEFGPGSAMVYSLRSAANATESSAAYREGNLEIQLPEKIARHWAVSNDVSIEAEQHGLAILIEKDFRCMHKDPSETDVYPNPIHA
jgi:hypothetical protein